MLPAGARQDFPQWRSAVLATLAQAEAACDGHLSVPMSIVRDDYFDEIAGGLRSSGVQLRHYTLNATDDLTPNEVVELIAADAELELIRPRLSAARYQLRRLEVGIRHIRF
jgi:hypothetical protein